MEKNKETKALVCGDVKGKFKELFKRVETVNRKAGPFDILMCVGEFFGDDETENKKASMGILNPPIPTYILGPVDCEHAGLFGDDWKEGSELGPNLTYLGLKGVLTTATGLSIAYVSGTEKKTIADTGFNHDTIKELLVPATASLDFRGIDVLLTSEWPASVTKWGPQIKNEPSGSPLISQTATILKPRYHFAGVHSFHYERPPYRNHRVLQESAAHNTRFIGLAHVANPDKHKWLYAFTITPMKYLSHPELIVQPADSSEFPYAQVLRDLHESQKDELTGSRASSNGHFFYDLSSGPDRENRNKGQGKRSWMNDDEGNDGPKQPRKPAGPCWFCLSSPNVAKHMVITVGNEAYMASAKGPLTQNHLLLLPIGHIQSLVAAPEPIRSEITRFKSALRECYRLRGMDMVFWERNYRTQHLQVQCVGVPHDVSSALGKSFVQAAQLKGFELADLEEEQDIWNVIDEEGIPYFYLELPGNRKLFTRQMRGFPLEFPREVLVQKELLDLPDKVDWRECTQTEGEETDQAIAVRKLFAKFDFTAESDSDSD